jgi:thioredoxin 1
MRSFLAVPLTAVMLLLVGVVEPQVNMLSVEAFTVVTTTSGRSTGRAIQTPLHMAVASVDNEKTFDETISRAGPDTLVVIDYSTTWCGPCKVIAPKFDELSNVYKNAIFLKVIGDTSPEASKLMKREGVRSVPSFHYFKNGEKVDVVNGANADAIEAAINKHTSTISM